MDILKLNKFTEYMQVQKTINCITKNKCKLHTNPKKDLHINQNRAKFTFYIRILHYINRQKSKIVLLKYNYMYITMHNHQTKGSFSIQL